MKTTLKDTILRDIFNTGKTGDIHHWRCDNINEFYSKNGYNFVIPFSSTDLELLLNIEEWCRKNISFKWTGHWFKTSKSDGGQRRDEINGKNMVFFAFESEKDATFFSLKWG